MCGGGKEFCDLFRAKRRGGPEEEVGKCVIKERVDGRLEEFLMDDVIWNLLVMTKDSERAGDKCAVHE